MPAAPPPCPSRMAIRIAFRQCEAHTLLLCTILCTPVQTFLQALDALQCPEHGGLMRFPVLAMRAHPVLCVVVPLPALSTLTPHTRRCSPPFSAGNAGSLHWPSSQRASLPWHSRQVGGHEGDGSRGQAGTHHPLRFRGNLIQASHYAQSDISTHCCAGAHPGAHRRHQIPRVQGRGRQLRPQQGPRGEGAGDRL